MASTFSKSNRVTCDFPGCERSYLRTEHLKRHRLTHKQCNFKCDLCSRQFTRNDLLHAHLRRHEKQNHRETERRSSNTVSPEVISPGRSAPSPSHDQSSQMNPTRDTIVLFNEPGSKSPNYALPVGDVNMAIIPESDEAIGFANAELAFGETSPREDDFPWLFQDGGFFEFPNADYIDLVGLPNVQENFLAVTEGDPLQNIDHEPSMSHIDYQKLVLEFPAVADIYQGDSTSLLRIFHFGLDYLDVCMPFFHHPTLNISTLPPLLILAVCSIGAFTRTENDFHNTGKSLHRHVRKRVFANVVEMPRVDVPTLQTMVVIEHVGFYALSRYDHELADVMHAMIVTLARRSNLLVQSFNEASGQEQSAISRWKRWADQEALTRLAHCIFVYDLDYAIYFMHPSLLSIGDIKVPLPCPPLQWQAATVVQWEDQMKQTLPPSLLQKIHSLEASLEFLLSTYNDNTHHARRGSLGDFNSNPFTLQILIHGIASAVYDHSRNKQRISSGPPRDYKEALTGWLSHFEGMGPGDRTSEIARSALVTFHFVAIMVNDNLSNIMMAAGGAYASGHAVTSQRAQEAFAFLTSTKPIGQDAYRHALEIVELCLVEKTRTSSSTPQSRQDQPPSPLYLSYTAFLGVLVLWGYIIGRSQSPSRSKRQHFLSRMMDSGQLLLTESAEDDGSLIVRYNSESGDGQTLKQILDREFGISETNSQELRATKREVCRLMYLVRDRLTNANWEISLEARRMLDSLLARDFVE